MSLFANLFSSKPAQKPSHKNEVAFLIGVGNYEVEIIGAEHHQTALEAICGPRVPQGVNRFETASLMREDGHLDNKTLVHVVIRGKRVGYLSPDAVLLYDQQLKARGTPEAVGRCQAVIRGGWVSSDGRKGPYHVMLDIPNWS
jgi:hypothetical protein